LFFTRDRLKTRYKLKALKTSWQPESPSSTLFRNYTSRDLNLAVAKSSEKRLRKAATLASFIRAKAPSFMKAHYMLWKGISELSDFMKKLIISLLFHAVELLQQRV
jgi:hypothetical protein